VVFLGKNMPQGEDPVKFERRGKGKRTKGQNLGRSVEIGKIANRGGRSGPIEKEERVSWREDHLAD